jgi:uncharacterized ParB-like nuclease family protein
MTKRWQAPAVQNRVPRDEAVPKRQTGQEETHLEDVMISVAEIYVPTKRRKQLDPDKVETLAEAILEEGQKRPIQVRVGKERYVLIEGLHRLEAMKSLGEETIAALIVSARLH